MIYKTYPCIYIYTYVDICIVNSCKCSTLYNGKKPGQLWPSFDHDTTLMAGRVITLCPTKSARFVSPLQQNGPFPIPMKSMGFLWDFCGILLEYLWNIYGIQWSFQEPIDWRYLPYMFGLLFQAYVGGYPHKIWPKIW